MAAAEQGTAVPRAIHTVSLVLALCAVAAAAMTVATLLGWLRFAPAADLYSKLSSEPPAQIEKIVAAVRGPLVFGGLVTLVTAALVGWMAVAMRRPGRRWALTTTRVGVGLGAILLIVDLNGGLVDTGSHSGATITPRDLLGYDLAPDWYPAVNAGAARVGQARPPRIRAYGMSSGS